MFRGLILLLFSSLVVNPTLAQSWLIQSDDDARKVLAAVQDGDQVNVKAGRYAGPWNIHSAIQLVADEGAILDGQGLQHGVVIHKANTQLSGLRIENWGKSLGDLHAGVFVQKTAANTQLKNLSLQGTSFGIWVDATQGVLIEGCIIEGDLNTRSQDRGNGIHLFNVTQGRVINNEVWHTRDGIYIDTSNHNELSGNYLHDLRYGVHYMYSHYNTVHYNKTERTRTGYALMQSHHLDVQFNESQHDTNYGVLMNFITYSKIKNNRVVNAKQGQNVAGELIDGAEGKALFIYNSVYNEISGNQLKDSDLAIHVTAGSEGNQIFGNAFINNRNQVKYVSNRKQEWSHEGQGNYWSDYLGWDMNNDGLGDTLYQPNDGIDQLLWKFPNARILFNSPGIILMRWVEEQFPVLKKPGVTDSYPLIADPSLLKQATPQTQQVHNNEPEQVTYYGG